MNRLADLVDGTLVSTHSDAIDALRAFFVFAACTVLTINLSSSLRSRFVAYGARATTTTTATAATTNPSNSAGASTSKDVSSSTSTSVFSRALDFLQGLQVPHGYFTHFYVVSILSSVFWLGQLLLRGSVFQAVAVRVSPEHVQTSMTVNQPSTSRMWFVHWFLGLAFYVAMPVAIWIEGTGAIQSHELTLEELKITNAPSLRTFLCLPLFLLASVVSPHYTAECGIYLSLAIMAAPSGVMVNKTLLSCLAFVAVNLGVTASTSKDWYKQKFGEESVRGKWKMIPGIY